MQYIFSKNIILIFFLALAVFSLNNIVHADEETYSEDTETVVVPVVEETTDDEEAPSISYDEE